LLYHNFPEEKILLVAHSNQALNDLFQKIVQLDISEHYLLRMGRGSEELGLEIDYSKWGRVNHMLARRMELLKEVERLAKSLGLAEAHDVAYSCDTARHFFLLHVQSRWEKYSKDMKTAGEDGAKLDQVSKGEVDVSKRSAAATLFPFHTFFADAPQPLFPADSGAEDAEVARGCWRYIEKLFADVEECHAFELLRNMHDRCSYLVTKHSRIIAMTCTHAALQRKNLVDLAFRYDSLIMEESAQVLEVETLIPMLLQQPERGVSRLKRVVLIGDHHQLPPVIKNHAIQKFGRLDQSMFARFVRLKVPTIDLNLQGRARPSIACLYNWRYRDLGDLQAVLQGAEYVKANPALTYDYQFVDVPDFMGKGESQPSPFYYQNLGEAEYAVGLFMYMRLKGYPASKITIMSTYNGQKHLIRDVLRQRCAWNPLFGEPKTVTTVDRYQGQQNDYIIISLVRTEHVGHIRDVRRLVVACSRARLGLYIFGRLGLFQNCFEIAPAFRLLAERPSQLSLEVGETFPNSPRAVGQVGTPTVVKELDHMWKLLQTVMQSTFLEASAEAAQQEAQAGDEDADMADA
jgi:intron-binding protein aquarius